MSLGAARAQAAVALTLLGAYAASLSASAVFGGLTFAAAEPFPLGGSVGQGGAVARGLALMLGLFLGWGVPGVSLALLIDRRTRGTALLARSVGLGIGYIFLVGLAYAAVRGHAPNRALFLVMLALPSAALLVRSAVADEPRVESLKVVMVAFVVGAALAGLLWQRLRYDGMNGDGTEAYELSRSLEAHPLPHWEMEGVDPPGRFGTPSTVPYLAGAYAVYGEMMILGRGELATRLPFAWCIVLMAAIAAGLVDRRGRSAWVYTAAVAAIYVLWNAYYVGYEAPLDLAEPAGTDALTMVLWLAGVYELLTGLPSLGVGFMALASATTYSAPLLTVLALGPLWWFDRRRGAVAIRAAAAMGLVVLPALVVVGWASGDWHDWVRQFRSEYWDDLVDPARRVASLRYVGLLLLMTGGLPLAIPILRRRLSASGRLLAVVGSAYLAIVLAGSYKNLHYLMPLPWIFLGPALEVSGWCVRVAATVVVAATFALSWPSERGVRRETVLLGTESCIQGFDYEAAALAAAPIYEALDLPAVGTRFGVGKHTFVRYALDLGGADCALGLSPVAPPGAVTLADGPASVLWTMDANRFARWRFTRVPMPSALLFPRSERPPVPSDVTEWTGRQDVANALARELLLNGFAMGDSGASMTGSARMLVPIPGAPTRGVIVGVRATRVTRVQVTVNGVRALDVVVEPGAHEVAVEGAWRSGWNVLQLNSGGGVVLEFVVARPTETTDETDRPAWTHGSPEPSGRSPLMRFYHCGDIGDIILSLPVVKAMGGGTMYLDPNGGGHLEVVQNTTWGGRMKFDRAAADYLAPLLSHQPYIDDVQLWTGQEYDVCLAEARRVFDSQRNIVSHYTDFFGLDYGVSDLPWLQAPDDPSLAGVVLLTRTLRYQSNYPEWMNLLHGLKGEPMVFLGLTFEHEVFCRTFDIAPRHQPVENALQAAGMIKSCRRYIANQGANHAIAVGLDKRPFDAETQFNENVCRFPNRSIRYF